MVDSMHLLNLSSYTHQNSSEKRQSLKESSKEDKESKKSEYKHLHISTN